jgi:cyclophilin family peptidyl-prolyl cis-trans isomerase
VRDRRQLSQGRRALDLIIIFMTRRAALTACVVAVAITASALAQTGTAVPTPAKPEAPAGQPAPTSPGAGPVIVVETVKGTFEFETYPNEAPKTVARIVELVNKRFYNGLRVHRVVPNFVMQLGDPTTRDMTKQADWGRFGSGTPIGVAEITKTRTHVRGAVAMAHLDDPTKADSQWYVTLSPQPRLDGKYTVFGKVISGMDVVTKLQVTDRIIRVTVRQ